MRLAKLTISSLRLLHYHHVPSDAINLVQNLYDNYTISNGTKSFITNPIRVGKGVLQGDCLSPLLFNMCINTLIKFIEDERIRSIGYCYCDYLQPRHWFQFADDTAMVITSHQRKITKHLLMFSLSGVIGQDSTLGLTNAPHSELNIMGKKQRNSNHI